MSSGVNGHSNGGFDRYVHRLTGEMPRAFLERVGFRIEAKAKERVNVKTGTLRRSLGSKMLDDTTVQVGSRGGVHYAIWQDIARSGNRFLTEAVQEGVRDARAELRADLRPK